MTRVALDARALTQGRGCARLLRHILPGLTTVEREYQGVILTTEEGKRSLDSCPGEILIVPKMSNTVWEQVGLPWYSRKLGAKANYAQTACAPLWGPPTVLHFIDDPRAAASRGATAASPREHVRRLSQDLTVSGGLRRAALVATCTNAIEDGLRERFGSILPPVSVVPLGVDMEIFYPDPIGPQEDTVFHLGSSEPRDATTMLVRAYAEALRMAPDLPDLVIAGNLGNQSELVIDVIRESGIKSRVSLLGWISDEELRRAYTRTALCVQPARYEGFGLQPLEAIACGAPLIIVAEPSVEEVIGQAGVVVRDPAPTPLATAIARLWRDKDARQRLRSIGPKRASEFPWSRTVEGISDLLHKLVTTESP